MLYTGHAYAATRQKNWPMQVCMPITTTWIHHRNIMAKSSVQEPMLIAYKHWNMFEKRGYRFVAVVSLD